MDACQCTGAMIRLKRHNAGREQNLEREAGSCSLLSESIVHLAGNFVLHMSLCSWLSTYVTVQNLDQSIQGSTILGQVTIGNGHYPRHDIPPISQQLTPRFSIQPIYYCLSDPHSFPMLSRASSTSACLLRSLRKLTNRDPRQATRPNLTSKPDLEDRAQRHWAAGPASHCGLLLS